MYVPTFLESRSDLQSLATLTTVFEWAILIQVSSKKQVTIKEEFKERVKEKTVACFLGYVGRTHFCIAYKVLHHIT